MKSLLKNTRFIIKRNGISRHEDRRDKVEKKNGMDDTTRWDFIEDYVTGIGVEELKAKYAAPL